jgi:exodeoxyribonuclease VII small subunit
MALQRAMSDQKPELTFEQGLESLDKIVDKLESGDLELVESLELFEQGVLLSQNCRKQLEAAETKVETLIKRDGKLEPEPFHLDDREAV